MYVPTRFLSQSPDGDFLILVHRLEGPQSQPLRDQRYDTWTSQSPDGDFLILVWG